MSSSAEKFQIREATDADFEAMSLVAAAAFSDNAAYQFLWSHLPAEQRQAANAWLIARRFWVCARTGGKVFLAFDGATGRVVGTIAFCVSALEPPLWTKLRAGYLLLPIYYGMQTLSQLDALVASLQGHRARAEPLSANLKIDLQMVTVDPALHRSGIGHKLLMRVLDEIRTMHGASVTVVLDTQKDFAAKFYMQHGNFQLVSQETLTPAPGHTFTNWVLARTL